ncbi:MAG: glycosyltransferase [Actinobacteria bacterium]|nr:glycosyltransferase [Actinomycetota bacterium]
MERIVIIIPTYNEEGNIGEMIEVLEKEIFPRIEDYNMSILIVDDNSPDGTAKIVKNKMNKYNNIMISMGMKRGLGMAFKRGVRFAINKMKADAIIKMDADFQHDPKHILDLVKKYNEGSDYIIGSRFLKGGSTPDNWGFYRRFLSKYGGLCTRIILFFPHINIISDVSSGLKLMSVRNVLNKVDLSKISSGFYYTTQLIYQAVNLGIKITEIPIKFKVREKGKTKMPFSNIPLTLKTMILLRLFGNKS